MESIDRTLLEKCKDISTETINKDILDTQEEINTLEHANRQIIKSIGDRRVFINKLKHILYLREIDSTLEIINK